MVTVTERSMNVELARLSAAVYLLDDDRTTELVSRGAVALSLVHLPATGQAISPIPPRTTLSPSDARISGQSGQRFLPPLPPRRVPSPSPSSVKQWLTLEVSDEDSKKEPIFDISIAPDTKVMVVPPYSYVIPTTTASTASPKDHGQQFLKIVVPPSTDPGVMSTFESTLLEYTAPPSSSFNWHTPERTPPELRNKLILVDEDSGQIVGELQTKKIQMAAPDSLEQADKKAGHVEDVVIDVQEDGTPEVTPISQWKPRDNPYNSVLIKAGNWVSRGVILGAEAISQGLEKGGTKFVTGTKPNETPVAFSDSTKQKIQTAEQYTREAGRYTHMAATMAGNVASKVGDKVGKTLGIQSKGGKEPSGIRGTVRNAILAVSTVVDSVEIGGSHVLGQVGSSAEKVVHHRYGPEAGAVASHVGRSTKSVAVIYIDIRGVGRRALLKTAGKSAVRAKMQDGREVVIGETGENLVAQEGKVTPRASRFPDINKYLATASSVGMSAYGAVKSGYQGSSTLEQTDASQPQSSGATGYLSRAGAVGKQAFNAAKTNYMASDKQGSSTPEQMNASQSQSGGATNYFSRASTVGKQAFSAAKTTYMDKQGIKKA